MPNQTNLLILLAALLGLAVAPACPSSGTGDDDDASDDDDSVFDPCESYESAGDWDDLDDDQRRDFMTCEVMPALMPMFQEFDAEKYASFGCVTCHGEDRAAVNFEMPNGLVELDIGDFPFSSHPDPETAAFGEFMESEVLPAMADLLGRSTNFNDPDFFGCYGCHERP